MRRRALLPLALASVLALLPGAGPAQGGLVSLTAELAKTAYAALEAAYGGAAKSQTEWWRNGEPLTSEDRAMEAEARRGPRGLKTLGWMCNPDCVRCYMERFGTEPNGDLDRIFGWLTKARVIYRATKDYVDDAIAFGDSMAGIPGFGVGWYPQRRNIMRSFAEFKGKYNRKIEQFLDDLETRLQHLHACEAMTFEGLERWDPAQVTMYLDFLRMYYVAP